MPTTYQAVLDGDHIEWKGEAPRAARTNQKMDVFITIPDEAASASNGQTANSAVSASDQENYFRQLADQWRSETKYVSSLSKMALHPAYQKIIGMGQPAVPLILSELRESSDHWLWALHSITGEDPAPPNATFREAVQAWIEWGKQKGYLT